MNDAISINKALYRRILLGLEYDLYMPDSDCSSTFLGTGDTSFSISKMRETALKYQHHTKRLQKRFFSHARLEDLCKDVHSFLYNHLQYKLDGSNQLLRSPACSWKSRKEGIDCKSYSIFASTILLNAGIGHYMRRIKQNSNPEGFTHVYIIVPVDQKKYTLTKGYYTIDGTINTLKELEYIEKDDVFVFIKDKGLGNPEQSDVDFLNSLITDSYYSAKDGESFGEVEKAKVSQTIDLIGGTVGTIANIVPGVGQIVSVCAVAVTALVSLAVKFGYDPCSGAFYDADYINNHLKNQFKPQFDEYLKRIEGHMKVSTEVLATDDLNTLLREIDLGYAAYKHELQTHTSNECSAGVLAGYNSFVEGLKNTIDRFFSALTKVLESDYNVVVSETEASTANRIWYFIVPSSKNAIRAKYRKVHVESRQTKQGIFPYGESNFDRWLSNNVAVLSMKYGPENGERYRREMLPYKAKIQAIREQIHMPLVYLISKEDVLRKEQYDIYLKYDLEYKNELLKNSKNQAEAFRKANRAFIEELRKIHKTRLQDEKRRYANIKSIADRQAQKRVGLEDKKTFNLLLIATLGFLVIKKVKGNKN